MAKTETGWTKEWPTLRGFYWLRFEGAEDGIIEIGNLSSYSSIWYVYHDDAVYLGPISPSDFEQLTRLREIAKGALQFRIEMNGPCNHDEYMTKLCTQCEIREALAHRRTGE